jgi:hypothetical protein
MISTAVLGFVLLAFMSIMTSAATLSSSSREAVLAVYDLQSALEDTMSQSFSNFQTTYNLSGAPNLSNTLYVSQEPASDVNHYPLSPTPFLKYWDYTADPSGNANPRPLLNEAIWLEIVNGTGSSNPVSYRINIRWKSHKGYYQRDFIDMVRSSR